MRRYEYAGLDFSGGELDGDSFSFSVFDDSHLYQEIGAGRGLGFAGRRINGIGEGKKEIKKVGKSQKLPLQYRPIWCIVKVRIISLVILDELEVLFSATDAAM